MTSPASPFDLTGRLAVVTGCRRGIGFAMAEALARGRRGHHRREHQPRAAAQPDRTTDPRPRARFTAYQADLADPAAVAALGRTLADHQPPVDILVNNAGTIRRAPAALHSDQDWDEVLGTNLSAPFRLAREVGRGMIERRRGKIIFTASMLSFQGGVNVVSYAAAKSGIAGLTRALANEWAPHGVNVNAIAPGYIATDNTQPLQDDPERSAGIVGRIPAGRWGRPDDLGGATVFLASAAADYVHGTVVAVDGGWLGR